MKTYLLLLFAFLGSRAAAQHIPDPNFAAAIRSECSACIDANDSLTARAATETYLYVSNQSISDLTGIQYFTSTGSRDIAYIKLSQTGNLVWAKQIAGSNVKLLRDFDLDSQGNSWLVGQFSNTLDFDPSTSATAFRTSKGSYDAFILKLKLFNSVFLLSEILKPQSLVTFLCRIIWIIFPWEQKSVESFTSYYVSHCIA